MRSLLLACALLATCLSSHAQTIDSDHDGLSDALETALLQQFAPTLMVSTNDCSTLPAQFKPDIATPTPEADNGTLYGQATPRRVRGQNAIELHFYHLWRRDCGRLGHTLDTEHVAALLIPEGKQHDDPKSWKAKFWYAAAHEDTVCDASQITRASTLHAEHDGAMIWVSDGKHASFLNAELCNHGCGGDVCRNSYEAPRLPVVNLGEPGAAMNGAVWMTSTQWPLMDKVSRSDFTDARLERLLRLPTTDVAWATPEKRPAQGAILGGNAAIDGALTGARSTDTAIAIAGSHTGSALGTATHATGHALSRSLHAVGKALGASTTSPTTESATDDPKKKQ
ncbi:hypothetical protein [Terriglobus roseus]|uniref:Uncharacterized protein n=1 Tax=Terriglobus roseus TaxID=392734 RepID=A0A1G7N9V8_9BACT|nr:hypothetical protein [Terriglobus roseus]SDF70736.1 hypothetical protein SAMN05444167_3062 [Terriglobus roseus]